MGAYQTYLQSFLVPFAEVLKAKIAASEQPEEIDWLLELSRRILAELKPESPLQVAFQQFKALTDWFVCFADPDFGQAIRDIKKGGVVWKSLIAAAKKFREHQALITLISQADQMIPAEWIVELAGLDPLTVPNIGMRVRVTINAHASDEEFCKTVLPKISRFAIF
jgi:hypothetical protein